MKVQRIEIPGLAHYSYIVSSQGKAAIIDPKRDFDSYVDHADAAGMKITHVLETHIHADYASGARELAEVTGAELCASAYDEGEDFTVKFRHRDLRDGDEVSVGELRIVALYTPGHTPEHLSYLVYEKKDAPQPVMMFSGDFVFVGSLGRPDLLGEAAKRRLAEELYKSLTERIAGLPDGLEIHPAHGAGSMCGAGMSDRPQSTLGYERMMNRYFGIGEKEAFIEQILGTVPPFPEYYKRMKRVNSEGPKILGGIPGGEALDLASFRKLAEADGTIVLDLRRPEAFGGAHIPGAINIGGDNSLSTWASWVLPYDRPIVLVGDDSTDYDHAGRSLIRVGLDDVRGHLRGGIRNWIVAGQAQAHLPQMSVRELASNLERDSKTFVLDVRSNGEWGSGHIPEAQHIMAGDVPQRMNDIPRDRTVHVICGSGYRSSVVSSLLQKSGYKNVVNVVGGMTAWNQAGLPTDKEAVVCAR